MNIPFLGNVSNSTAIIGVIGILGLLYFGKDIPSAIMAHTTHPSQKPVKSYDDQYHMLSNSSGGSPLHYGGLSAYSARSYYDGCVQTEMCMADHHWDSGQCGCVPNSTNTNDPSVLEIENKILSEITHRAQNISSVIPNIETIKLEIKTHEGQIKTAVDNMHTGYISSDQIQQFIDGIVTDVATKLQIQLNDLPGNVPDYYNQYYDAYQNYLNQLNNNYYNYYQPAYQYYPGTTYDYYQPYQYQYPDPYYGNGQYPSSYPYYGSDQQYYYIQQPQPQQPVDNQDYININHGQVRIGPGYTYVN